MIDLHTHTIFSDGELLPAELARRAKVAGYRAIAITDHADASNLELIVPRISAMAREYSAYMDLTIIAGVELTHVPPGLVEQETRRARALGAQVVVVHGETIVEPVERGTNLAAIEAGVDVLAHPGLITEEEVRLAAEKKGPARNHHPFRARLYQRACADPGPQAWRGRGGQQRRSRSPRPDG